MDWNKAKNLILLFLCLLNAALFALIFNNNRAYRLTAAQEQAIRAVLAQNNIIVTGDILRNFSPMRQIEMQAPGFDHDDLIGIFFDNADGLTRSVERDRIRYRNDTETLIIDGSNITYRNRNGGDGTLPSIQEAERLSNQLMQRIRRLGGNFVLDGAVSQPVESEDGLLFRFRGRYRGVLIHSNAVDITVNGNGITRVEFSYLRPVSFVGVRREITSADEALLTVMHSIRNMFGEHREPMYIEKIDLVYYSVLSTNAVPYYRVFIYGLLQPFLVNAYLNSIL